MFSLSLRRADPEVIAEGTTANGQPTAAEMPMLTSQLTDLMDALEEASFDLLPSPQTISPFLLKASPSALNCHTLCFTCFSMKISRVSSARSGF